MATAKAGKSKVGKTPRTAAKKPSAKRPVAAAKKGVSSKVPAKKVVAKKPVAKHAVVKKAVKKVASRTTTQKPVTRQAAASRVAKKITRKSTGTVETTKTVPARGPATKNASQKRMALPQPAVAKRYAAVPMKTSSDSTAGKAAGKPRRITPEQALANTRALLEAKKEHDRQPQPWQLLDQQAGPVDHAGHQSPEATDKAEQLHDGESRMQAIQGSISSSDRKNQGKRDNR